jgi:hypothetical protein
MPIRQVSEGRPIEHIRTNGDILGESDARHCHRPGTWQMGVHHDLSPFGRGRGGTLAAYRTECARSGPRQSLG